jgi:hypothetical protein
MLTTENGESMAEALVEQPGGGAADGVQETEEQRLREVKNRDWRRKRRKRPPGREEKNWRGQRRPPGN